MTKPIDSFRLRLFAGSVHPDHIFDAEVSGSRNVDGSWDVDYSCRNPGELSGHKEAVGKLHLSGCSAKELDTLAQKTKLLPPHPVPIGGDCRPIVTLGTDVGTPANPGDWNEIENALAILVSKKSPGPTRFRAVRKDGSASDVELKHDCQNRCGYIIDAHGGSRARRAVPDEAYRALRAVLTNVHTPYVEPATGNEPGVYLDTGDGRWMELFKDSNDGIRDAMATSKFEDFSEWSRLFDEVAE